MAIRTELVVGEHAEATALVEGSGTNRLDLQGHNAASLTELYVALTGEDPTILISDGFRLVAERSEEGPWLTEIPGILVDALAALPWERAPRIAAAWGKKLDCRDDPVERLEALLVAMSERCRSARDEARSVFLWMGWG